MLRFAYCMMLSATMLRRLKWFNDIGRIMVLVKVTDGVYVDKRNKEKRYTGIWNTIKCCCGFMV